MIPAPGSWQHDLVELLETLKRHDVPFLIVGGYAVAHAGHLRATKDLDVFVPRAAGVDALLAQALSEFLGATVSPDDARSKFLRFFIGRPGAVDVIRELPGITWRTAWKGRSTGLFFSHQLDHVPRDRATRARRARPCRR